MKFSLFTAVLILFVISLSSAQTLKVENLSISPDGKVKFSCIVYPHHSDREEYEIKIFTSADNFQKPLPLQLNSLRPNVPLPVSFDGNKMIGDFDGAIEFDVRISATIFPVQVTTNGDKLKRGKSIIISWNDFHESGWYDVDIYQRDILYQKLVGNHRGTSYTTILPKKMPKGEYEIRVTPTNQKNLVSEDYTVSIKSGKGGLIIGAGGVLAGAGVLLISGGDGSDSDLPVPPDLPGN